MSIQISLKTTRNKRVQVCQTNTGSKINGSWEWWTVEGCWVCWRRWSQAHTRRAKCRDEGPDVEWHMKAHWKWKRYTQTSRWWFARKTANVPKSRRHFIPEENELWRKKVVVHQSNRFGNAIENDATKKQKQKKEKEKKRKRTESNHERAKKKEKVYEIPENLMGNEILWPIDFGPTGRWQRNRWRNAFMACLHQTKSRQIRHFGQTRKQLEKKFSAKKKIND